jgi:SsrA-binding protein
VHAGTDKQNNRARQPKSTHRVAALAQRPYVAWLARSVARRVPPAMSKPDEKPEIESIAKNRRARHDYAIIDTWEAGLVLTGSEVKSLRDGKANLSDAYGIVRDGEIYLINLHISVYERASYNNHEPTRTRKLLLHKREIGRLIGAIERQGLTLIPLELYFKRGIAKVAIALGKGKKQHDKREDAKARDADREIARAVRTR